MQEKLLSIVSTANSYLADYILVFLLVGVGLFFTIRTRFVQVRYFGQGMKNVFGKISFRGGKNESGLSSFQALATAIAAQVGTGNIVGASGAILLGGPGAIFWMWVIAFLGMATIYAEAVLAQETRVKDANGEVHGGPVYYIKKAFPNGFGKFLAGFFAIAITLALGFMGSMVQSNSIAEAACSAVNLDYKQWGWVIGIVIALVSAFIFLGGIQRIASVTEKLVPIMAVFFLLGGLVVLGIRVKYIPETFAAIFKYAFTPQALLGGGLGAALKIAISQGAKRGLFSNEAGMGSTPHAHAMANVKTPHEQGTVAMIGVFIDTFVVLTMTALVIISTLYVGEGGLIAAADYKGAIEGMGIVKTNAMQMAFSSVLPTRVSKIFVAVCLLFFAYSTIISWNFFGKINVQYLFKKNKAATVIYSVIAIVFVLLGTMLSNDLVWELTDFFNYLMVIPNAIALIALSAVVAKSAKGAKNKKN